MASRFDGQLRWLHKVRLYPTCAQERGLVTMLRVTRELYNALLQQRRDAWTTRRASLPSREQYAQITKLREAEPRFGAVYRECEDAVLHRLDLSFAAFFRRVKRGETPGYPRFKPGSRWNQLEFPHGERALKFDHAQRRVRVPGVGAVRLRKVRMVPEFGRAFLVTKNGRWYAVFEAHRLPSPVPASGLSVGVDRGVRVLAALSDRTTIENLRPGSRRKAAVERHQRALDASTVKDAVGRPLNVKDPARIAAVRRLARAKEREANARRDWLHKVSRTIVQRFDRIALEGTAAAFDDAKRQRNACRTRRRRASEGGLEPGTLGRRVWDTGDLDPRESRVRWSHGDRGRCQIQFADVCRVRACLQGKPGGADLCLRSVWP